MERTSLFYKSPLPFLTFVNCKGPHRRTSSQHWSMLRYCVCAIRNHPKNKEQVCWNSSCYRALLNYNSHKKNKELKKQPFRICLSVVIYLSWWKNISKKKEISFLPSLQYCQFGQYGWKSRTFFMKISRSWTCRQLIRKFSYCKNLWLFWLMLNTAFAHL